MTNIINKHLFLLLFLFVSTATYCMEPENKNTEFSLNDPANRIELVQQLAANVPVIESIFYYENHQTAALAQHVSEIKKNKLFIINGYSLLAFAAMAVRLNRSGSITTHSEIYPEYAPYEARKALIKKLQSGREYDCKSGRESASRESGRESGIAPTPKDYELALIIEKEAGRGRNDGKSDLFDE